MHFVKNFQKVWTGTLASYIGTIYFAGKLLKIIQNFTKKGRGGGCTVPSDHL